MHVDERVIEPLPVVETVAEVQGETVATFEGVTVPVPKEYTPPVCSACTALRVADGFDAKVSFSDVTAGPYYGRIPGYALRYIKCRYCNNTFKDLEKIRSVSPGANASS